MITATTRVFRSSSAAWREIDGQVAIISIEVSRVRILNDVAGHIWKNCDNVSVDELVRSVCGTYRIDTVTAEADVATFLEELEEKSMVRLETGQ